jgi:competence protein ComEC
MGMSVVEPFLRRQGINRLDMVILTHPHDDHVQGLVPVLRDFRIGMVLDPGIPHGSKAYQRFLAIIHDRHLPYHQAVRGQKIDFGDGVQAQVLSPPPVSGDVSEDQVNDTSAVIRFTYGRRAILITGDAGFSTESDIIASRADVRSDVLKVGHHGSKYSTGDEWLSAVRPSVAVISVGRGNSFGHPSSETLQRLAAHQARVYRTDECGAVTVGLTSAGVSVRTCIPSKAD